MIAAFALPALIAQDPRCELSVPGRPLHEIVAAMAKQTGLRLRVDETLGQQPAIVRFRSVPFAEAKSHLAEVLAADWVEKDGIHLLTRKQSTIDRLLGERAQRRESAFREALAEMFRWASASEKLDDSSAQRLADDFDRVSAMEREGKLGGIDEIEERVLSRTAEWRLMYEMARNVDPAELARLGSTRIVFSTRPTAAQRPTPNVDAERLAQYVAEHNAFARRSSGQQQELHSTARWRAQLSKEVAVPISAQLVLTADAGASWATLSLRILDDDGTNLATAYHQLTLVKNAQLLERLASARNRARDETKLALSPVATELASRRGARGSVQPLSQEALTVVSNPEKHDPLGIVCGPALLEIAERESRNVVAYFGDSVATGLLGAVSRDPKPALVENAIVRSARLERREGWLLGIPEDRLLIESERMSRAALGAFMRSMREKGYAGIADWSSLAAASWLEDAGISNAYAGFLSGESGIRGEGPGPWHLLKLLGSLERDQLGILRGGGTLPLQALEVRQAELVRQMIYLARVQLNRGTGKQDYASRLEPTSVLPTGLPGSSTIRVTERSQDLMLARVQGRGVARPLELEEMAIYAAMAERPDLFPWTAESDRIDGVRFGSERTITLVFDFGEGIEAAATAKEEIMPGGAGTPLKDVAGKLSEADRAKFEAKVVELRAQFAKMTPEDARRLNPSPAPPP